MVEAFLANAGSVIVHATAAGRPRIPVILPKPLFSDLSLLDGDSGARALIEAGVVPVVGVEIGRAVAYHVDTPEALEAAGGSRP